MDSFRASLASRQLPRSKPSLDRFFSGRIRSRLYGDAKGNAPAQDAPKKGNDLGDPSPPWKLMGRVVTEDSVALRVEQVRKLVISAAARKSSLKEEDFENRLEVFLTLLPDLGTRVDRLQPDLLFQLIDDLDGVVIRVLGLREFFPSANISLMVARSPSLLLATNYSQLPSSIDALRECLPEGCCLDPIVEQVPFTLMCDMKRVMEELSRLMPTTDVASLLANQPDIIFSVQRGTLELGPGAEF
ncbi:hypothetical protein BSKO_11326 [Bryopsis sp. KO-2023]|nr:hypothetical protein BSKO_11326 [Bryopsis sp. KO-2023]